MLTMEQVKFIKDLYERKGLSLRNIAKITGRDFKTVKKYVQKEDWNDAPKEPPKTKSKLDPFKETIDGWLLQDLKARPKQRHTAKRVYDRLCEEFGGTFTASYRTVRYYVSAKKKELYSEKQCFLPLEHPGSEAQVDFGEADFIENGMLVHGYYLNFSTPYSNGGYLQLCRGQNQECLLSGLKSIFEHVGVVPTNIWFDNLSAAVISIEKNRERKLADGFQKFSWHYGFKSTFCNPRKGHEKGHIENKVGYHRRNFLVPIPEFDDINEYNSSLLQRADSDMDRMHYKKQVRIRDLFEEEKNLMRPLPEKDFEVCRLVKVRTNKYGKFTIDQKFTYSSSPACAQAEVWVKLTADKVIVMNQDYQTVVIHERLYGNKQESMNWYPYLSVMAHRPMALKYTGFYQQLPDPLKDYLEECQYSNKAAALRLLCKFTTESDIDTAVRAFTSTLESGVKDLDSILTTYYRLTRTIPELDQMALPNSIPQIVPYVPNATAYDELLLAGR